MSITPCTPILNEQQIAQLRQALAGFLIALSFGAGVDSTAMLVALYLAGIRPDIITFADTGGEKPQTLVHLAKMNEILRAWGFPTIDVCRKVPLASTGYPDLYGECLHNQTLPSLAFGMKSCSQKWKVGPQDQFLKGVKSGPSARPPHPLWLHSQATGRRFIKLIGYDCGKADIRRSKNLPTSDKEFSYAYPLQIIGWGRADCIRAITAVIGAAMVPIKSACFFCPASKPWELFWLAAHHPDLLERALLLERTALTGRHSHVDEVEFGAAWDEFLRTSDRFPSAKTTAGLGRNFAWNQWARVNDVIDAEYHVRRTDADIARFIAIADAMKCDDNALDRRIGSVDGKVIAVLSAA